MEGASLWTPAAILAEAGRTLDLGALVLGGCDDLGGLFAAEGVYVGEGWGTAWAAEGDEDTEKAR